MFGVENSRTTRPKPCGGTLTSGLEVPTYAAVQVAEPEVLHRDLRVNPEGIQNLGGRECSAWVLLWAKARVFHDSKDGARGSQQEVEKGGE